MERFPHLLSPLVLNNGVRIRNRSLMGSMHTGLEDRESDYPGLAEYFAARARGHAGLLVTGGIAPTWTGRLAPFASKMTNSSEVRRHRLVTRAVHDASDTKICMQILHAGRYSYHPWCVAPSRLKSPISPFTPWALSTRGVERERDAFVRCAGFAKDAGYDGVEIMGSEGYLINQFISARTNRRKDRWGGSFENRTRFATEIVRRTREAVGPEFIIIFRLSMLDLVEGGSTFEEVETLAVEIEKAGATILNTGIGWHEARVPTIATSVPRAAFTFVTKRLRDSGRVSIPLVTTNRINTPEIAEQILSEGSADMVSMARPFLADPDFILKAEAGKSAEINTCIACNQACLDHVFKNKKASCLVNPRAGRELEFKDAAKPVRAKRIAVVGAGPAGLSFAITAAERGHDVTLFEKSDQIGGQFNLAKQVPGKEEFAETLRYFRARLERENVTVQLNTTASLETLRGFDEVILATGVAARVPEIPGAKEHAISYLDVFFGGAKNVGERVALVGAGGIGFDVAELLTHDDHEYSSVTRGAARAFLESWGVDTTLSTRGGLKKVKTAFRPRRKVVMLQRSEGKMGDRLAKTTGWIHRAALKQRGVTMLTGVEYERIDARGIHLAGGKLIEADTVVLCTGQVSRRDLEAPLREAGKRVHLIGGADVATELDAKRAIRQGFELAMTL